MISQNRCQRFAPRVPAACSCSLPSSRSIGITSRATNGTETKIVASTIEGIANRTWNPCSDSQVPNQPPRGA